MRVLYVKSNSERHQRYQLRTIIYEESGSKYVKKEVLCDDAIYHLKRMKDSYEQCNKKITNKKIKLAKIIDETKNSLTFEFIEGISLEKKIYIALHNNQKEFVYALIDGYLNLLKTGFKVTKFDSSNIPENFYSVFGKNDYSCFDGSLCFDCISNIDLIFSNILFRKDEIYLIDYEWVFNLSIPIDLILFRALELVNIAKYQGYNALYQHYKVDQKYLRKIDDYFVRKYVTSDRSFFIYKNKYLKLKKNKDIELNNKDIELRNKDIELRNLCNSKAWNYGQKIAKIKTFPVKYFSKVINKVPLIFNLYKSKIELGNKFNGHIIKNIEINNCRFDTLCIFSHFDKDDIIDSHVVNYIKKIFECKIDIIFVSTARQLSDNEIEKIKNYCKNIIIKENIGYDFGAWKTGIKYLGKNLKKYDRLIVCNDSVYAPLFPLSGMFEKMKGKGLDFWGITDNYEIKYHIQSYFMVFGKDILSDPEFIKFWKNYRVYKIKKNIIKKYEIGLSQLLLHKGYKVGSYCEFKKLSSKIVCNSSHVFWRKLIIDMKCPVLKVELLRDNPVKVDIADWERFIIGRTIYDFDLIHNHLKRVKNENNRESLTCSDL